MYTITYLQLYKHVHGFISICTPHHTYIHCHPHTDCFVLSELFSVARHVGRAKPASKPIQLYVKSQTARPTSVPRLAKGIVKVFI